MTKKLPNPIDVHVGSRVRLRRSYISMSQEKLGDLLGLTFQQVQKYEKGANRIGASRLFEISQILGVPISFFFDDLPEQYRNDGGEVPEDEGTDIVMDFVSSLEGLQLNRAFMRIHNAELRKRIIALVRTIGEEEDERSANAAS